MTILDVSTTGTVVLLCIQLLSPTRDVQGFLATPRRCRLATFRTTTTTTTPATVTRLWLHPSQAPTRTVRRRWWQSILNRLTPTSVPTPPWRSHDRHSNHNEEAPYHHYHADGGGGGGGGSRRPSVQCSSSSSASSMSMSSPYSHPMVVVEHDDDFQHEMASLCQMMHQLEQEIEKSMIQANGCYATTTACKLPRTVAPLEPHELAVATPTTAAATLTMERPPRSTPMVSSSLHSYYQSAKSSIPRLTQIQQELTDLERALDELEALNHRQSGTRGRGSTTTTTTTTTQPLNAAGKDGTATATTTQVLYEEEEEEQAPTKTRTAMSNQKLETHPKSHSKFPFFFADFWSPLHRVMTQPQQQQPSPPKVQEEQSPLQQQQQQEKELLQSEAVAPVGITSNHHNNGNVIPTEMTTVASLVSVDECSSGIASATATPSHEDVSRDKSLLAYESNLFHDNHHHSNSGNQPAKRTTPAIIPQFDAPHDEYSSIMMMDYGEMSLMIRARQFLQGMNRPKNNKQKHDSSNGNDNNDQASTTSSTTTTDHNNNNNNTKHDYYKPKEYAVSNPYASPNYPTAAAASSLETLKQNKNKDDDAATTKNRKYYVSANNDDDKENGGVGNIQDHINRFKLTPKARQNDTTIAMEELFEAELQDLHRLNHQDADYITSSRTESPSASSSSNKSPTSTTTKDKTLTEPEERRPTLEELAKQWATANRGGKKSQAAALMQEIAAAATTTVKNRMRPRTMRPAVENHDPIVATKKLPKGATADSFAKPSTSSSTSSRRVPAVTDISAESPPRPAKQRAPQMTKSTLVMDGTTLMSDHRNHLHLKQQQMLSRRDHASSSSMSRAQSIRDALPIRLGAYDHDAYHEISSLTATLSSVVQKSSTTHYVVNRDNDDEDNEVAEYVDHDEEEEGKQKPQRILRRYLNNYRNATL
ncbi:hypothetical protein ACA910_014937 [Epithemia clementina (nom. ined.)]